MILNAWRSYSDEASFIFAETEGEKHNTIDVYKRQDWKGEYQSIGSLYCILLFEKEKSINRVITGVNYNAKENIE